MGCSNSKNVQVEEKTEQNELIQSCELSQPKTKISMLNKSKFENALMMSYNKDSSYYKTMFKRSRIKNLKSADTTKKEPFTLTTIGSGSEKINLIKINTCSFLSESLIPIWFEKNTYIRFITVGKWRIDKNYEYHDSFGMPSSHILKFNYGALVARVGSGEQFVLPPNEYAYYNKKEGPLYLKMNLPKKIKVNPEGAMTIKIFDGTILPVEEIFERIGWKEKTETNSDKNLTDIENDLIHDLNSLRMNPILFYENCIRNKIWTEKFLKQMKKNNDNNGILPLSINNNCYTYINNYVRVNCEDIFKKTIKKGDDKYLNDMQEKLSLNIQNELLHDNIISCKTVKKNKSYEICVQYLFDRKFRKNIFNPEYKSISVNMYETGNDNYYFVILALMKGENDDEKGDNI